MRAEQSCDPVGFGLQACGRFSALLGATRSGFIL